MPRSAGKRPGAGEFAALLNMAGDAKLGTYGLTSCGSNFRIQ